MGNTPSPIIVSALGALLVATSCAGPPAQPLETQALAETVVGRSTASREVLVAAISLYGAPPLGLTLSDDLDPTRDGFWHAHALAFEPVVRSSRRLWRATEREQAGAGTPNRTGLSHRLEDLSDLERQNDVAATVDLLGLLGLGPKAAERDVAARVTGFAHGQLEQSAWRAVFNVDRARVGLAAARRRDGRLNKLADEARGDLRRLELLFERGRIPQGLIGRARAALAAFESQRHSLATATARAREALANAAGLLPSATALDAVVPALLDRAVTAPPEPPSTTRLLDLVPALRSQRLAYALAEARLRAASAEWWPSLRIGPGLKIRPDEVLTGGVLALELPWPGAVQAQIEAALERRARAREAIEDGLVAAANSSTTRRQELLIAQEHRQHHAMVVLVESAAAWRSARARMWVEEGLGPVETWLDALQLRARGLLDEVDANENVLIRDLSLREATGAAIGLEPGAER